MSRTFTVTKLRLLPVLLLSSCGCRFSWGLTTLSPPTITSVVRVFDNAIPTETRAILHQEASASGLGHKVFSRDDMTTTIGTTTTLEQTLHQLLLQLSDTSPYVEYWCRQEWRHIEAHADVDENLTKTTQREAQFRYPTNGHVLYLQVGSDVRGPTCLFEDVTNGGDLAASSTGATKNLLTIPAVEGRLLRFPGDWLHAVPRPTDIWLRSFVQGGPTFTPEEQWGRSVILFNTWTTEPPLDVPLNSHNGAEECPKDNERLLCNPHKDWAKVTIQEQTQHNQQERDSSPDQKVKVWLLGDQKRRNYRMRTVNMMGDPTVIRQALEEESIPSRVELFTD